MSSLRLRVILVSSLMMAMGCCCCGCLKAQSTASERGPSEPETPFDSPADHQPAATQSYADTAPQAPEPAQTERQPARGLVDNYTGAVVYTDPAKCVPCVYLESDLHALEKRGWTVGSWGTNTFTGSEDWIFSPPGDRHNKIPTIEYWENGEVTRSHEGYTTAPTRMERRDELAVIVQKHPAAAE